MQVTKRTFLKAAGSTAVAATLPGWRRASAARPEFDLIVIGAGTAGIPAAVFAASRGARVLAIEQGPIIGGTLDRAGGQLAAAGTLFQRRAGIEDTPEDHFADCMRINGETGDPGLTLRFAREAGPAVDWLAENGLTNRDDSFPTVGKHEPYRIRRCYEAAEGGRSILAAMQGGFDRAVAGGSITVRLNTGVVDLVRDSAGAVIGVVAKADGKPLEDISARNVLIATGGCASNARMFEEVHGVPLYTALGHPGARGSGILLGLGAGGFLTGADRYVPLLAALIGDEMAPGTRDARFMGDPAERAPWELWVNADGERFIREDHPSETQRSLALGRQPGHRMWLVLDQRALDNAPSPFPTWQLGRYAAESGSHPSFAQGATLTELAVKAAINPLRLKHTVSAYNSALERGDVDPLGRMIRPAPITRPPFHAVQLQGFTVFSFGGLAVDTDLRVIRSDGNAVPGLYAAGEVIGAAATSGRAYTNGSMLTSAIAFGRYVGRTILLEDRR